MEGCYRTNLGSETCAWPGGLSKYTTDRLSQALKIHRPFFLDVFQAFIFLALDEGLFLYVVQGCNDLLKSKNRASRRRVVSRGRQNYDIILKNLSWKWGERGSMGNLWFMFQYESINILIYAWFECYLLTILPSRLFRVYYLFHSQIIVVISIIKSTQYPRYF